MSSILVYTFFGRSKATSKGLYTLDFDGNIDKLFVPNRFATKRLLSLVPTYKYIIGIADHNKNASKSRFDPKYINNYSRRELVESGSESYFSNLIVELPNCIYEYSSTTNGPCNRSAYLVMDVINRENLATQFGFFHLSKKSWQNDLLELLGLLR